MSSISVHDARLPTLSSANLCKLDSSGLDKDHFLRSYIRSQQAHLSSYAREGRSAAASWNVEETDAPPKKPSRVVELESGFGTPLLKPRAAIMREVVDKARAQDTKQGRSRRKVGRENEHSASSASAEAMKEGTTASRRRDDESAADPRPTKRARTSDVKPIASRSLQKAKVPAASKSKENMVSRKAPTRGGRDPDSEEEYSNRLAERRERRRAKKAIVNPKPDPPPGDTSDDSDDGKKRKRKKWKKGKGLSIPAGLALMHGFSATNIGKNRLTLDPAVGVFNKGKASMKTEVKKAKTRKSQSKAKMFSEDWFLNKTKWKDRKADSNSGPSSEPEHGPDPESESPTKPAKVKTQKHKRSRSPSTAVTSPSDCEEVPPRDQTRSAKTRKTERTESPIWDIELENGQLPSDSRSDQPAPSESGTKVAGTVLLDTRAFSSRWAIQKDTRDSPEGGETVAIPERIADLQDDQRSDGVSTIDPSHSASQVAYRGAMFSRFFDRRDGAQDTCVTKGNAGGYDDPAPSAVQSTSLLETRYDDPRNTVENRMTQPTWDKPVVQLDTLRLDRAEPALSSPRALSGAPAFPERLTPPASARPLSCSSSTSRQEVIPTVSCSPAFDSVHPGVSHVARPESTSSNFSLPPPIVPNGGIETTDLEVRPDASPRDWTTEFLGLLGNDAPTDLFLSSAAGHADSLERPMGDDIDMEADALFAAEDLEPSDFPGADAMDFELDDFDAAGMLAGIEEEESYRADEDTGSAVASWNSTDEELYDIPYPRKRVTFANNVLYYDDDDDGGTELEPGGAWDDIIDAGLSGGRLSDFGDPDGRSAASSNPDSEPIPPVMDSIMNFGVAVEDESSSPEEEGDDEGFEMDQEGSESVLGSLQRFSQGRALLMGVASEIGLDGPGSQRGVSAVEEDVARNLRGHWRPQRF